MELPRVVLLTSTALRHKYMANMIGEKLDLKLIITEEKSKKITATEQYDENDAAVVDTHFRLRAESEQHYFGDYQDFPSSAVHLEVPFRKINSEEVFEKIQEVNPDYILLFGTSIIKNPILEAYPTTILNLHLGLSPYYKGSGTNLWPLYYSEPECVGGTFHLAILKVDAGAILHQFRPDIEPNDNIHDIGNKTIQKGGLLYPKVVLQYHRDNITPQKQQEEEGKVLRVADFKPNIVRQVYQNFESGMLGDYLANQEMRNEVKPIISNL